MLILKNVTVKFDKQTVLDNFCFSFDDKKVHALTGTSGIGKTTLINAIAGLVRYQGTITHSYKKVGYIFQEPRLFPWMTALENVECVCDDKQKAREYLNLLLPDSADKYPNELSGGMKQRVSIARALAYEPDLLLLDEPFKGLDEDTKKSVISVVSEYLTDKTAILITHDKDELVMCDKIYRLENSLVSSLSEVKSDSDVAE
ncbi:MAG: ABC transporter ATP-binding protein [Ruminococcaceae bacterium]|nr:ABC transporter ATP-binding protein [Oscillospiraceae bacterium]